jgi:hypothetical protein
MEGAPCQGDGRNVGAVRGVITATILVQTPQPSTHHRLT